MSAGRPADSWPALGAVLARVVAQEPPVWVCEETRRAVGVALVALTRDARAALAGRTTREAPEVLGISRPALMRELRDGWLAARLDAPT